MKIFRVVSSMQNSDHQTDLHHILKSHLAIMTMCSVTVVVSPKGIYCNVIDSAVFLGSCASIRFLTRFSHACSSCADMHCESKYQFELTCYALHLLRLSGPVSWHSSRLYCLTVCMYTCTANASLGRVSSALAVQVYTRTVRQYSLELICQGFVYLLCCVLD